MLNLRIMSNIMSFRQAQRPKLVSEVLEDTLCKLNFGRSFRESLQEKILLRMVISRASMTRINDLNFDKFNDQFAFFATLREIK